MKPAIVLLSGGLDSTTTMAIAKELGFNPYPLTILYGQRNRVELIFAQRVLEFFGIKEHKVIELDLRLFGGSSLTDQIDVKPHDELPSHGIPNTYVPARNTIMLSLALAYAEVKNAFDIFYGANVHDYSNYPDCRPLYIEAYETMANLATKSTAANKRLKIHAPLVGMTKAEIIKKGLSLGVRYELTHSCYDPIGDKACGKCSACFYRKKGFFEANVADPTTYADANASSARDAHGQIHPPPALQSAPIEGP